MTTTDIGLIGLAVMGQNLVLNMADHGYTVGVHNRTTSTMREFVDGPAADASVVGHETVEELVDALSTPRRVMLMVKAGAVVDRVIEEVAPLLDEGDVIIDGGNSRYTDTIRRTEELAEQGIRYVGAGVSGGEEGARHGPSIMPGGDPEAWPLLADLFQAIAADAPDGRPCCDWVGPDGAGHFVKMIHNGIEYGDMQVIAEAYDLMSAMGMANAEMAEVFRTWNDGVLDSFLVEITADILAHTDPDTGESTVDVILDAAGQKGTGTWTAIAALEAGQPLTLVAEAVFARVVSALVDRRRAAAGVLAGPDRTLEPDAVDLDDLRDALYASKITSYAQGFMLLADASAEHDWDLDLGRIASLWREGCIIRAVFLDDITAAYEADPELDNLLLADVFTRALADAQPGWRRVVRAGISAGIPLPAYSTALAYYDGIRSARTPANLVQAQRDYFGAHTYERVDGPRGEHHHTDWTGRGGAVTSGSYNA
ncbi:decarboxylating NADP(+)-dependent phosphogluconate dehydrogenase [Salsipaludibacter albus]|uniref:decarboxylating NADP(+)-dependent phosphogluconate dehydrogenase n=1 Tax=Salsipaludibacter albus TaxID=2849650 RepID=UPI001EE40586|nr:decarboxylating NADP(+)-dependent phosphogluconate dehydrogenase [Salsipaludibacter albus]MBY5162720.1 decarboxylating NADP(+)-dependent phosphogluconate dehydrogenase [Salsipaludibacter albus]